MAGGRPLRGRVRVPGDKSVSHRALLLAAMASGTSRLSGLSAGDDVARTAHALAALGAGVEWDETDGVATVNGGRDRLGPAPAPIDLGNSGTSMRLLAGVCASLPWTTVLEGDQSLSRRPMDRVVVPLRAMGADAGGGGDRHLPPLSVGGGSLHGIDYELHVPSAQVKGAILLAGLAADGETVVRESVPTRAHTEEMLAAFGAEVDVSHDRLTTRVRRSEVRPFELEVPGDPSQAAFWVVAACITPGSDLVVEGVYVGQARSGFLDVLARMGAAVDVRSTGDGRADLHASFAPLRGTEVSGAEVPGLIDEIPALAVAAAAATGTTAFRDAGELRVKESDRVATLTQELSGLGCHVEALPDGLVVRGDAEMHGGDVDSHGDHRIAMALAVVGMAGTAGRPVRVHGWEAVDTSYPGFDEDMVSLCH